MSEKGSDSIWEFFVGFVAKYVSFEGRASRSDYWWFVLFVLLVNIITIALDVAVFGTTIGIVSALASAALFFPHLSVAVRRLHDTGRSGWWLLIGFIPFLGWWLLIGFIPFLGVIILIAFFVMKGEVQPNQYGSAPISSLFSLKNSVPLLYLIAFLAYYRLAKGFVQETLLNLTPGRVDSLQDFPIGVLPEYTLVKLFGFSLKFFFCGMDSCVIFGFKLGFFSFTPNLVWLITFLISIIIVSGFVYLKNGNLTPKQYDIRIQALTVVAVLPFITYFILHIMWLKENDSSWYFDLIFMEEMAGFTLSNEWPFETVLQDSRWQFYRVGLYNAIRVVVLSIIGCTFLGIFIGVSRLSRNRMLAGLAESYVEFFRNMPLVVQLFFLYTVVLGANLPPFSEILDNSLFDWIFISNRGVVGPKLGIENMSLFLLAIGVLLGARIYIRFSERVLEGNPTVPILMDTLFSASILIVVYGIFNVVEWNYTVKPQDSDGGLLFRFLLSLIQGILTREPLSMFILGIILLVGSALTIFRLDEAGMNVFTVDDSSEGLRNRSILWSAVIITMIFLFYQSIWTVQPNLITEKEVMVDGVLVTQELSWGLWRFEEGTSQSISSVFLSLWIGLTLYTTAQVAEIVRGSIQSLPRGQVEAAISLGLSPYQRLRLVILPQALRSMIPSMTNQYLNCWKNSSLAFVVGFSDFYAVFTTIVNNAGQAVPVFLMILLTYQAGSLTISAAMNYINSSVTKVKI